uniref:Uncharacterized protein n=1 Tax=Sus scrofa TaxID=9823 RepID=A0A286ZWV7_PIG
MRPTGPPVTSGLAFSSHLHGAVLGAGGKLIARVGEAEVQDLVRVLGERLHLHAGHPVIEPPELLVPGRGRSQVLTWVSGHVAGHLELVPGHGLPLAAHQPGGQHVGWAQAQEDLVNEAVGEQGCAPLVHRDILVCGGLAAPRDGHAPGPLTLLRASCEAQ